MPHVRDTFSDRSSSLNVQTNGHVGKNGKNWPPDYDNMTQDWLETPQSNEKYDPPSHNDTNAQINNLTNNIIDDSVSESLADFLESERVCYTPETQVGRPRPSKQTPIRINGISSSKADTKS